MGRFLALYDHIFATRQLQNKSVLFLAIHFSSILWICSERIMIFAVVEIGSNTHRNIGLL